MAPGKKTSLEIDPELWRRFRVRCAQENLSLRDALEQALRLYLKAKTKKGDGR
jgi:hypothetical protein